MPHAIIRGRNGRRHEVDFGDAPVSVRISSSEENVEIFIEADFETVSEERRRFATRVFPATSSARQSVQKHAESLRPNCSMRRDNSPSSSLLL